MEKLVVKTAVKTVLIILAIFIVVFTVFNVAFPQHMATLTESTGNYSLALKYAQLHYSYTKKSPESEVRLARCFDDSVLLNDDGLIIRYGDQLVSKGNVFDDICRKKDEEFASVSGYYRHRVYSKLSVAHYNVGTAKNDKEHKEKAVALAATGNGWDSFEKGNAFMLLSVRIYTNKDSGAAKYLLDVLEGKVDGYAGIDKAKLKDDAQKKDYNAVIISLRSVSSQS